MTPDLVALLPIAHEAIDIATDIVRARRTGTVTAKGDRDMVTEIDLAVEQAVRRHLQERTPEIGFLGEEEGSDGTPGELTWALDPVDGTANLVHDIPLCAVSLGLVHLRRSVLGVIDAPFLGTRYSGAHGHGAFRDRQRISTSDTKQLDRAIVAIGDYAVGENAPQRNRARLAITTQLAAQAQRVRMLGSAAIDLAWLAEGKLDATIALSNKPWDTAAGVAIAREAGATVVDIDGTEHTLDASATIAAAPGLLDQVTALVQQVHEDTAAPDR